MKQLIIIIAALAFMLPAHSQGSESYTDKKNEFNIGFFNAFELNNFSDLGIGYLKGRTEENYNTGSTTTTNEQGASVLLGPLGVFSINFHF